MSLVLPLDIIVLIIDIVGENKDTNLLKQLSLVSHSFLHICRKHLFAAVDLRDAVPICNIPSSKRGFVKLLQSRPDVAKYIRKLKYKVSRNHDDNHLLPPILFLPTFSRLNCLTITAKWDWNTLDSSLTSALLHLMHLPTIDHINLSYIQNFPLSSLTPCVNLLRLDILQLDCLGPLVVDNSPEIVMEMMPKIREFRTFTSSRLTTKMLHAKWLDGRPAFNPMNLRCLSTNFTWDEDGTNIRYLLQNAKLLERLELIVGRGKSLVGYLSCARALKILNLVWVSLRHGIVILGGICEELEAIAGHNVLEALSFRVSVDSSDTEDFVGSTIQKVENVLVKPGWSMLRQVSFELIFPRYRNNPELLEALQSLPDKYLNHLPKLESVAFNYSASVKF